QNCVFGLHKPGRKSNDAKQSWVWALPEGKFYAKRNWFKIRHMEEDPTQMREQLYSNIATKMGTYANQANLIRFFINNEFMGTFNILDDVVMYSYIVAMFYGGNVPSQLGGLFDGASGATFEYNSNPKKYDNFIPNIESPFKSDAISPFAKTFSEVDFENDEEVKAIAEYFDYDQFLRFMVMEFLTGHWDGYWMEQTNDGAYIDVMDNNKMYYLGQDFDATFGVNIGFGKSFIKVPYSEYPSRFPRAVLINKLLENNHTATLFRNYLEETVDTIFNKEVLGPYIEARHQFIYPDLEWDRSIEQQSPGHLAAWTAAQTKENLISPVTGPGKKHGGADWGLIEWIEAKEQLVREDL
ncbi:coth protein-domain-containing protein, partial [Pilobolus umbonatus]